MPLLLCLEERGSLLDSLADLPSWPLVEHVLLVDGIFHTAYPSF